MIILIDNYDSFTYNLYQLISEINPDIKVFRNDEITCNEIDNMKPEFIIISPGPCYPKQAGICEELVVRFLTKYKILGVCLGHQAICEACGGKIVHAKKLMHGKQSIISINNENRLFNGLDERIKAARYHSLAAEKSSLPENIEIISEDDDGEIMAVNVKGTEVYGVQFHPESILTPNGKKIIENFFSERI